jgi:hypothetical protein
MMLLNLLVSAAYAGGGGEDMDGTCVACLCIGIVAFILIVAVSALDGKN